MAVAVTASVSGGETELRRCVPPKGSSGGPGGSVQWTMPTNHHCWPEHFDAARDPQGPLLANLLAYRNADG